MSNVVIRCEDLSFSYGGPQVLDRVSLEVAAGEFLGLVGPNGGGKSTLLKLILGLIEPQRGRIEILGRSPFEAGTDLGYVPQYPPFARDFPITVKQTVLNGRLHGHRLWGRYSTADKKAVTQSLREISIVHLADRQLGTLSGGELQRVLLARALVTEPRILILDEPTANIDHRSEGELFDLLKELNQRMTILVVSHDIAFISSYVGRVACLDRSLVCHPTQEIDADVIHSLYGEHVSSVAHVH